MLNRIIGLTFGLIFLVWILYKPSETVTVAKGLGEVYGNTFKALTPR